MGPKSKCFRMTYSGMEMLICALLREKDTDSLLTGLVWNMVRDLGLMSTVKTGKLAF